MKSGMDLLQEEKYQKMLKFLYLFMYVGVAVFIAYAIYLIIREKAYRRANDLDYVLNCKSKEFIVQSLFLLAICSCFLICAIKVYKSI